MYLPRSFAEHDLAALDALIARDAFVSLITVDEQGRPFASHLPVLYFRDGQQVEFRGHWARPNPQAKFGDAALLIVHGPHAYVSPRWYARPEDHVPTWNYAIAHVQGRLVRTDDREELRALVSALAAIYEGPASSWQPQHGRPEFEQDLHGIVGFRLRAEQIQLKFKLNQNHPLENRQGVIAGLQGVGGENALAVAELMRERLPAVESR